VTLTEGLVLRANAHGPFTQSRVRR
jgi:hypothetical protein